MPEILNIATAADESYLLPLMVTLSSLREKLRPSLRPVVYLLNRGLTEKQIARIADLVETHSIVPGDEAMEKLPKHSAFPPEATFPLLLPDVLPKSVRRILFLDPDMLVLDDVGQIWESGLGENVIAAVADQAIPSVSSPRGLKDFRMRGIPHDAPYFNAGVLLVDLAQWRAEDVSARACEYIEKNSGTVDFFHQEALNALLWNKWLPLDGRWNLVASIAGRRYASGNPAAAESPGIVHFAGRFKPWKVRIGGPFADLYYEKLAVHGKHSLDSTAFETSLGIYDRYVRDYLYGIENLLWKNRLI